LIELVQGSPGSGKSAVALCMGIDHLLSGGILATNFDLIPGWSDRLAEQNIYCKLGLKDQKKYSKSLWERCFKVGKPDTLYKLSNEMDYYIKNPKIKKTREGRALLILDEAQLYFNSRNWQNNFGFIEFFTQHRKLGWNIILVAHYKEMIDKQVLPLVEIESRFRNLKNVRIPLLPIPLSPINTFLIVKFYAGFGPGVGMVHSRSLQFLNLSIANLYDSCEVFAFDFLPDKVTKHGYDPELATLNYTQPRRPPFPTPSRPFFLR